MDNHHAAAGSSRLSKAEIETVVVLLKKLKPGYLPPDLFVQCTRLMVTSIIEVVPLRLVESEVEVLLFPRDSNDPVWRGLLHTPGTVIRPADSSVETALQRLLDTELGGVKPARAVFVEHLLHIQARGKELALIYWIEVQSLVLAGTFYNVSNLPANLVATQRSFIESAAKHFLMKKSCAEINTVG